MSLSYRPVPISESPSISSNVSQTFAGLVTAASLEVRTGYFGLCASLAKNSWTCSDDASSLARRFSPNQDPLDLIGHSAKFKDNIVFPGLV